MVNFTSLSAEIGWRVWSTLANFNGFSLGFITAATSLTGGQQNVARELLHVRLFTTKQPVGDNSSRFLYTLNDITALKRT